MALPYTFTPNTRAKSAEVMSNLQALANGSADDDKNSMIIHRRTDFVSHVMSGLTIATSGTLSSNIAAGYAIVNGQYLATLLTSKTFTASKDTYVFLKDDGSFSYSEVANGAAAPATVTNADGSDALLLALVISSAGAVTYVTQVGFDALNRMLYSTKRAQPLLKYHEKATVGTDYYPDSASTGGSWLFAVPKDYKGDKLVVRVFLRGGGTSGAVRMQRAVYRFRLGSVLLGIDVNVPTTVTAATVANKTFEYTFEVLASNFVFGDVIRLDVARLGADGADTYASPLDIDGMIVEYNGRFI